MREKSTKKPAAPAQASEPESLDPMGMRLALRLAALRTERGWSLDELADASGISRATLSRLERGETSPTASLLGKLCAEYGLSTSRLLAEVEQQPASLIRADVQPVWVDPESGFRRRIVSPSSREFKMELVEATLPVGAVVAYDKPAVHGMEVHLWMLEGVLELTRGGIEYRLTPGDCLRLHMSGGARFVCPGPTPVRYAILVLEP